jgi:hypothetical protein
VRWERYHNGGCHWSARPSYISFFRHACGLPIDYTHWHHYETLAQVAASRFCHADFAVICERPSAIRRDEQGRPHCASGPSHEWRDGWRRYYWHGVSVPGEWIESPDTIDIVELLAKENAETRRAGCEIVGWARILEQLEARVIDTDPDPIVGTLYECDLPDAPKTRIIKYRCGTGREFADIAPAGIDTALGCQAWAYRVEPELFRQYQRRT